MRISYIFLTLMLSLTPIIASPEYKTHDFLEMWKQSGRPSQLIMDPDLLLTADTKSTIGSIMASNFTINSAFFIVCKNLDSSYFNPSLNAIDVVKFSENLIFDIYSNKKDRDNTLFVIYALDNRVWRVRTGSEVRRRLDDAMVDRATHSVVKYLKDKDYQNGFVELFRAFVREMEGRFDWGLFIFLGFASMIIGFVCCQNWRDRQKQNKIKELAQKLKTLDEIKKTNKNFKEFRQENCIICLESFTPTTAITDNQEAPLVAKQNTENLGVFLNCGHNFHKECIQGWLKAHGTCPICRLNIADETLPVVAAGVGAGVGFVPLLHEALRQQYVPYVGNDVFNEIERNPTAPNEWSWNRYVAESGERGGHDGGPSYAHDNDAGGNAGTW